MGDVYDDNGLTSRTVATHIVHISVVSGTTRKGSAKCCKGYLANIRLKGVSSDVLITAYEPVLINPLSETARTVGAGMAAPAAQSGFLPMSEVFKLAVSTFKVNDWNLFGSAAV
eukprot:XP_015576779.1 uncharacterized protein LOC8260605 [Ricinus communis]